MGLGKTQVGLGVDQGCVWLTLFKPVGPLFKTVGPLFKTVGPIGLKWGNFGNSTSHHLLSLFKPIGAYYEAQVDPGWTHVGHGLDSGWT